MLPPGACRTSSASARRIVWCRGVCVYSLCPQPAPIFGGFRIFSNEIVQNSVVVISVFSSGAEWKWGGGCVRSFGHEHDVCQAEKAESTDPRMNYAAKYATARGHLTSEFADNRDPDKEQTIGEGQSIPSKWTRRVWVANCCWPPRWPRGTPREADCGYCDGISQNANPAALSSSLNAATAKASCWAEERRLGALRQSVPQNGRVHLHIIESKGDAKKGTGRKTSENVMTNRSPSPPTPFCQRPPAAPPINVFWRTEKRETG